MPYKRSYASKKKPARRTYGSKSVAKVATAAAKRAVRGAQEIKAMPLACFNTLLTGATVDDGVVHALALNYPIQGAGNTNRIGQQFQEVSLHVKFQYLIGATPANNFGVIRVVLFRDNDNVGAVPAWGDVFDTTTIAGSAHEMALVRYDSRKRFNILYDAMIPFAAVNSGQVSYVHWDVNLKLNKKLTLITSTTAGDYGMGRSGQIYIAYICDGVRTSDYLTAHSLFKFRE